MSIPKNFTENQTRRLIHLQDYVSHIEENYFNIDALKEISFDQIVERYELAKATIEKGIDSSLKVSKADEGVDPEMKMISDIMLSLNPAERMQLKEKILEIKRGK